MSKYDLRAMGERIKATFPEVNVFVDKEPTPSGIEFRCDRGRVRVWQFGNAHPQVETAITLKGFPLVRAVLDDLESG
jgi:hypothetical protein